MEKVLLIFTQFMFYSILGVYASSNVTHVVQREGRQTTLTCPLPPDDGWSECKFQHHDGSQGQCSVFNRDGGMFQNCGAFGQAELVSVGGVCKLVLTAVVNDHNGTWSCEFTEEKQKKGLYWGSNILANYPKDFTLAILHEPSSITAHPGEGSVGYFYQEWSEASLTVENVAPKPKEQWMIDDKDTSHFGVSYKETKVNYIYQDLEVTKRLHYFGRAAFEGKDLLYRLTLDVFDEFGNSTEDFVREGKIKLNCIDCPKPSSTTTLSSTPNQSTESSTTPSLTTATTASTIPSTSTPTTHTTTLKTTQSTQPAPTTMLSLVDCQFNLTDMSGPLQYPQQGINCNLEPSPSWTININCNGNCINIINININSMYNNSTNDPSNTRLRLTTSSGDRLI